MDSLKIFLEESRRELLDLSTRNRLLAMPLYSKSARILHIHDEKSDEVFRILVTESKSMVFQPIPEDEKSSVETDDNMKSDGIEEDLPQPEEEIDEATGLAKRHVDTKLQTKLTSDKLQKRLLSLFRDAQTILEEQGVDILYLSLGSLKWFEADQSDIPRYAPLILVPVKLERTSARDRFKLKWREEDVQENLSLRAKLNYEFGINLPDFPEEDKIVPSKYAEAVANCISSKKAWSVETDIMTLGFFSFAKFLMYRDLDPETWPDSSPLLENEAICALLRDGFGAQERPFPEDSHLDDLIPAAKLDHVVDADSSQTYAIEIVRNGCSAIIQGPPGTGKSQSITNLIATAVLDGKKVLFVAEKLAALEVVKRRLVATGLGDLCLELHSQKANKRIVLDELKRTWQLGRPRGEELETIISRLTQTRNRLNDYATKLHKIIEPSGITPFRIFGELARLGERGLEIGKINIPECVTWSAEERRIRKDILFELLHRIEIMGSPSNHPWRGSERPTILNIDLPQIREKLDVVRDKLIILDGYNKQLSTLLHQPYPSDLAHVETLCGIAAYMGAAPKNIDTEAFCNNLWASEFEQICNLVEHGRALYDLRTKYGQIVNPSAFEMDLSSTRLVIASYGRSFFRFLRPSYRRTIAAFKGLLRDKLPRRYADRLTLLDDFISARQHLLFIRDHSELGRQVFGKCWQAEDSDWRQLDIIVKWMGQHVKTSTNQAFRQVFSQLDRGIDLVELSEKYTHSINEAKQAIEAVFKEIQLNLHIAFNCSQINDIPFNKLSERIDEWYNHLEDFSRWTTWYVCAQRAKQLGLSPIVEAMEKGGLKDGAAIHVFDRCYFSALLHEAVRIWPELSQFDGIEHERIIADFRELDKNRLMLSKYRILSKHYDNMPTKLAGTGATGILLAEMERKRGHRPIRKLLSDAGAVIQDIKPVLMMSPLSVAQYLEPGHIKFDLLIIDEASQILPVDAMGAFIRARQHVVVGDSKQLPPTRFFTKLTSNDDIESDIVEEEIVTAQAKDMESILSLCSARGLSSTMLRWHYRSRHQSLIAVSNHEFYNDRLFIVPSPYTANQELGLVFRYVEGGSYDRGQSRTNRVEAHMVCSEILKHIRRNPDLSLGVAAFSVSQQQAIYDELEVLRRENPEIEFFFTTHPHEPFFVKNLENVQGDERDVIMISVGYGPDANGNMHMAFGPLSGEGGERRLNVLISRAKKRCIVFSSMRADDIDLSRATGQGVRAFKTFLQYAETGRINITEQTSREEDSPFEEAVRHAVENLGYEVHPQIGVAGFYVDLGVVDPAKPGRYLLGIECDGKSYHSSKSARDRDRLRQSILEDHGWVIHRIWSTDWFQRPQEQIRKIATVLEEAKRRHVESTSNIQSQTATNNELSREADNLQVVEAIDKLSEPYIEANFNINRSLLPYELSSRQIAEVLLKIIKKEGPIHEDELVTRIRTLWGLGRAGARIQRKVSEGIAFLVSNKACQNDQGFITTLDCVIKVRCRSEVYSSSLRKTEYLPPEEIKTAIISVIDAHHGVTSDEIIPVVSRLFGYKTTSSSLRQVIENQIELLKKNEIIKQQNSFLIH